MRVCLLPTDLWGVGSYRVLFPGRELERLGHEVFLHVEPVAWERRRAGGGNEPVRHSVSLGPDGSIDESFDADVYVVQLRFERWMPGAIARLRELGKVVVGETDDLYHGEGVPHTGALVRRSEVLSSEALTDGFAACSAVTVSTPALAEFYGQWNRDVRVLPNFLDWEMWEGVPQQSEVERPRLRVGWMGWAGLRGRDFDQLRGVIGPWLEDNPQVDFVSIGEPADPPPGHVSAHDRIGVPPGQRLNVPSVPFHRLAEAVPHIDIGLVPLAATAFNECKSWLKGLEYAACGVPCVASPRASYREWVEPGVNGFLASKPAEWRRALDLLVADDGLRRAMGRAARAKAAKHTIQEHAPMWEHTYQRLVGAVAA